MGLGDKMGHAAEEAKGKIKEATGKATGNEDMEAQGQAEQTKAGLKKAGEQVKDAGRDAKDAFK
ncbi:CsbD family protein [Georgenia sp. AZ-5]|uniref:CsbD family protein n=1 Tax=Georgenia sp. AZ-5 TaxID=3367526 RepID=UPI003753ED2A